MMKRSWIPAALMGTLALGYLAGSTRGPRGDGSPPRLEPPQASAAAPATTPLMVEPSPVEPPPPLIPDRTADDGAGAYPAWNGVDLDCKDVGHPVRVSGPDPHRLDNDGNGIGCESY
jgi:micrococcal nuclease